MIEIVSPVLWPNKDQSITVECAGEAFLKYLSIRKRPPQSQQNNNNNDANKSSMDDDNSDSITSDDTEHLDLYKVKDNLSDYSYYEILSIPMHATQNQVRQAYHKSSLRYHPDKTGRGEKDAVFLNVKDAFETLSDIVKRRAYDSSLDFDESIPSKTKDFEDEEFYESYGDCFDRNLRFASPHKKYPTPPNLGKDDTPLEDVHIFYDYWTHFASWRDFSLVASKVLKHDTDLAGDRYEKRWMEKEIGRKAKSLKRDEMSRITSLVERAMTIDPRLRRQREQEKSKKKQIAEDKIRLKEEAETQKREEEEQRLLKIQQEKVALKKEKEIKKNLMKKLRQGFRRATDAAFQLDTNGTWQDAEDMRMDVDLLCEQYNYDELTALYNQLVPDKDKPPCIETLPLVHKSADMKRNYKPVKIAVTVPKPKQSTTKPWSTEESAILTKGMKKFPAGGSNRWGAVTAYVNNSISSSRTKEECIAQYKVITNPNKPVKKPPAQESAPTNEETATIWTDEQNKQLQLLLSKNPPSMDKNERWTNISKGVTGKTKKQCVERFKAIRIALKLKQDGGK